MTGHLFDTCTIRHWYARTPSVVSRAESIPSSDLVYVSAISIGEIEFGHTNITSDPKRQVEFRKWIHETFDPNHLTVTSATGWIYAKFRRELFTMFTRKGKYPEFFEDRLGARLGVDENDLWLVAQAREHGLKFVTMDGMSRIKEVVGTLVDVETWPESGA